MVSRSYFQLTPSSFTEQEKENYIDLTCDTVFPKKDCSTQEIRQIYLNFTEWRMPSFAEKSAMNSYPFRNVVFILIRFSSHGCD